MKYRFPCFRSVRQAVIVWVAALALHGCSPPAPRTPEELVKRMSDRLAAAQTFSFSTQEKHQRLRAKGVVEVAHSRDFLVQRPAGLAFTQRGGERGSASGAYDGKTLTLLWSDQKAWARVHMPPTLDAALDRLAKRFNTPLPVGDLLYTSAYEGLITPHTKGRYVGREKVGSVECDHAAFTHPRVDWEVWIAVRGDPTPCRVTITTKSPGGALTSDLTFSNWNLSAIPAADAFVTRVPEGFERIMVAAYDAPEGPASPAPAEAKAAGGAK
jgi:hypothetical protein